MHLNCLVIRFTSTENFHNFSPRIFSGKHLPPWYYSFSLVSLSPSLSLSFFCQIAPSLWKSLLFFYGLFFLHAYVNHSSSILTATVFSCFPVFLTSVFSLFSEQDILFFSGSSFLQLKVYSFVQILWSMILPAWHETFNDSIKNYLFSKNSSTPKQWV